MRNNQNSIQKAREYAFLLLKFRQRSEKEIYQRLKQKKFPDAAISQTLVFLKDKGFVDDRLFAKAWVESRIKKPLGLRRIKQELILKGIDEHIISALINEIKEKYPEKETVLKICQQRFKRLKGISLDVKRRRLYAFLLRRGFSPEIVQDTISHL